MSNINSTKTTNPNKNKKLKKAQLKKVDLFIETSDKLLSLLNKQRYQLEMEYQQMVAIKYGNQADIEATNVVDNTIFDQITNPSDNITMNNIETPMQILLQLANSSSSSAIKNLPVPNTEITTSIDQFEMKVDSENEPGCIELNQVMDLDNELRKYFF